MADAYNPASLRVKEVSPSTTDLRGVVTLVLPEGTVTDVGRGGVLLDLAATAVAKIVIGEVPAGTINGTNAVFTLAHTPTGTIMLWRSMELMYPGVHYNLSGGTITYTAGNEPAVGDAHMVIYKYA